MAVVKSYAADHAWQPTVHEYGILTGLSMKNGGAGAETPGRAKSDGGTLRRLLQISSSCVLRPDRGMDKDYSYRKATMGSTFMARRAGM